MMLERSERAAAFRALHDGDAPFLIPNPWDRGTAMLLAGLGFQALATTSFGLAVMLGRKSVDRDAVLANCAQICEATVLPVNADLENGFADQPADAAESVALAFESGAVGASIEDATQNPKQPIYDFNHAVERVAAAVEVAHSRPVPMIFTARAENLLYGVSDLDETIRRLQAFEAVGADVLYAPGLRDLETIETVISSVNKPVNIVMGFADPDITMGQLAEVGVTRVSVGGALSRLAMGAVLQAAEEMKAGQFSFLKRMASVADLQRAFL